MHVRLTDHGYEVTDLVHGDTVTEVLTYVQFHASDLLTTFRRKVAAAAHLKRQDANAFIADFVAGLEGYTYLEGDLPEEGDVAARRSVMRREPIARGSAHELMTDARTTIAWPSARSRARRAPMYTCRGRAIFCSLSLIISSHCASHPGSRPIAKSTVK